MVQEFALTRKKMCVKQIMMKSYIEEAKANALT